MVLVNQRLLDHFWWPPLHGLGKRSMHAYVIDLTVVAVIRHKLGWWIVCNYIHRSQQTSVKVSLISNAFFHREAMFQCILQWKEHFQPANQLWFYIRSGDTALQSLGALYVSQVLLLSFWLCYRWLPAEGNETFKCRICNKPSHSSACKQVSKNTCA